MQNSAPPASKQAHYKNSTGNFIVIPISAPICERRQKSFSPNFESFNREVERGGMCTSDSETPLAGVHHLRKAAVQIRLDVQKHLPRASIPLDVLTLRTATPTRLVADSSRTKKTRSESGKVRASSVPMYRTLGTRKWGIDFVIRYVGDQFSPLLYPFPYRKV